MSPLDRIQVVLPPPRLDGPISLEAALARRRSTRAFASAPLSLQDLSQLLWAAQGVTSPRGFRTAPSAGALYPLETHVVAGAVEDLPDGVYRYLPNDHGLVVGKSGDLRGELCREALHQRFVEEAPVSVVFSAVYDRITGRYGRRGIRYAHLEAGHAAQNLCLQAVALGLGSVVVGAFRDEGVRRVLGLGEEEVPLYLVPVGRPLRS
ncbi:MAG: SagB/ThcOx family dehydrogenase [Desulfacinum sp.]|nr:SagB/ThcOx family dehydrogenase [Desulfacinum sp.]MBZ4658871.1 nitroreductase [Desulfacinum sp.]